MVGSLFSGISGIKTHQFGLDNTSNNIANVNTIGYRGNITEFKSLFATNLDFINSNSPIANDYNYGSTVASNGIKTTDGSYVAADGDFNVAYSGRGWFVVGTNPQGQFDIKNPITNTQKNYFTRDGSFSLDANGYIVNSSGYFMYGVNLGKISADGGLNASNNFEQDLNALSGSLLQPLQIPANLHYRPTLSTDVKIALNLNRTQHQKPISSIQDPDGNFDRQKFLSQDVGILTNGEGKAIDAKNFSDLKFSFKDIDGKITKEITLTYGEEGEFGFRSIGELINAIKAQTNLNLDIEQTSNNKLLDDSLHLSNHTGEDFILDISGKLAEKLGLKRNDLKLDSAIRLRAQSFNQTQNYANGSFVNLNGLIYQKNGDGPNGDGPNGNPMTDNVNWTLFDTTAIRDFQASQTYQSGVLVASNGKIYQRTDQDQTMIPDPNNPDSTIPASPENDTQGWSEIADATQGNINTFQQGTQYPENTLVSFNGGIYQKINGAGGENPLEDMRGWSKIGINSVKSEILQYPYYESNTEVYNADGQKFILKSQYMLTQNSNNTTNPPTNERWEVQSAIYSADGKTKISQESVQSELQFTPQGNVVGEPFDVPFEGGNIRVDLTKSQDNKVSSNFSYADSSVKEVKQDGVPGGVTKEYRITPDGFILVTFTNGKQEAIGRFGIASFINDQGLKKVGANLLEMDVRTVNGEVNIVSGPPILSWDENNAKLKYGRVLNKMLEQSNVDSATALTNLIIYQRGYQMSAKAITTADDLMKEAIGLKR